MLMPAIVVTGLILVPTMWRLLWGVDTTVVPLAAAIDRIVWLPTTLPHSPVAPDLYVLLWIVPMFAFDIVRHRRVPRAYLIWAGAALPLTIAAHLLWGTPWWLATARELVGVAGP